MTFKEFQDANLRRAAGSGFFEWSIAEQTNALCGEAGEAANLAKKLIRGDIIANWREEMGKELADIITYADLIASALGLDTGEITRSKFNEVSARWGVEDRL